ncbi:MAG: HAMP domain-containing histidine kinase [Elusimicrobia bacterium]|nr:HAMP domain-containing histidine kinase [Elusimicrobiota bacterium]
MNLRTKLTLYVSFLLIIVIVAVSYNIFVTQKRILTQQISENRTKAFQSFVSMCNEAIKVKDDIQVNNAVKLLVSTYNPSVVYAGYINSNGVVMFSSRDEDRNMDSVLKARIKRASKEHIETYSSLTGEQICEFATPFFFNGSNVGTFVVGFSQDIMKEQIDIGISLTLSKIKIVVFVTMFFGILLSYLLGYSFGRPIKMLTNAAEQIAKGNLDVEIKVNRKDEIGKLSTTFNDMAKQIKELDSMKDSFVSSVSHELRSPLSAIDGYCDLLIECVDKNYSKEQELKGLKIIKQATVRLTNFINNILDLAKMKANKLEVKKTESDIGPLIEEIVALYQPLAEQQKKKIYSEINGEIPKISMDAERIKQVITNLVSNAMKFTKEEGSVGVKAFPNSAGYGNEYIEVWVQDDGVGIPKQQVDLVFQKFYQVKDGEFKKPKGTGLGLTIVYEMIKLHDGYVWAESDLGKGTTFKFVLPK